MAQLGHHSAGMVECTDLAVGTNSQLCCDYYGSTECTGVSVVDTQASALMG